MMSPYRKLGLKIILLYVIACVILLLVVNYVTNKSLDAFSNFCLIASSLIAISIASVIAMNYFSDKIDKIELSKIFDQMMASAAKEGATKEKLKELELKKERIINFVMKL